MEKQDILNKLYDYCTYYHYDHNAIIELHKELINELTQLLELNNVEFKDGKYFIDIPF